MLEQLEAVAVGEREAKEARAEQERQKELEAWRERRREQLERLIEVRFPTCCCGRCCWCGVLKVNIHDQTTPSRERHGTLQYLSVELESAILYCTGVSRWRCCRGIKPRWLHS